MTSAAIRVLDLAEGGALIAGKMLAQLGADVILVEPPGGSPTRWQAKTAAAGRADTEERESPLWTALASDRRSICCDLDSEEGRDLLGQLAASADILITGGMACDRRLDWQALRADNPHLVHLSISPFGEEGPKRGYAASDLILWAAGGALFPSRDAERPPVRIGSNQALLHAGADGAVGALVALAERERTGRGQLVTVSAQASVAQATLSAVLAHAVGHPDFTLGSKPPPMRGKGNLDLSGSGSRTRRSKWPVRDGLVEMHLAMGPAAGRFTHKRFAWLCDAGLAQQQFREWDWARGVPEALSTGAMGEADLEAARDEVAAALASFTKADLALIALRHKLLLAPVMTIADLAASEHFAARGALAGAVGASVPVRLPAALDGLSARRPVHAAPAAGAHAAEILGALERAAPRSRPAGSDDVANSKAPLAGLKVVDLAWVVAGPMIGRVLADCGAEVVRVESSLRVETARMMGPFPGGDINPERSALYENCNAGKLGLSLDLANPAAREVVRDLAAWGDVLVESFAPGQMTKWGLGYDMLSARNPRLVMLSTSLMGQSGPFAGLAGFGNIGAALSGFQAIVGHPDGEMIGPYGPYTDYVGPRFALAALLARLAAQRGEGLDGVGKGPNEPGAWLDIAQVEAGLHFLAAEIADFETTGTVARLQGNRVPAMAPH
ncbi:MAG: CoA transferase, partial [Sphingopyxis sp.]